jgi:hypothetical protein
MTTPRRSIKNSIIFGAVLATAGAALVVPSVASAATPTTPPTPTASTSTLPVRLERACLRIPNLETRTSNFITRLNGDASTRGSLLWLQAQIDTAKAKNHPQLATVLENRLAVRTQTLKVLTQRHTTLEKLADLCRQHGVDI